MIPELPVPYIQSMERRLVTAVSETRSPFTGTSQVQDWGGEWWEYQFEMAVTQGADARRLSAFFAALGGARGRFLFRDPGVVIPAGIGNPYVMATTASGNSLPTAGWSFGLRAGEFFQLGADAATRLYQITEDVAPVGGEAVVKFVPALRGSVPNGTLLGLDRPAVLLRLAGPVPTVIGNADKHRFSVTAREAL